MNGVRETLDRWPKCKRSSFVCRTLDQYFLATRQIFPVIQ